MASQTLIHDGVDIVAELVGVDRRQAAEPFHQHCGGEPATGYRFQACDGCAVAGDRHPLSGRHPIKDPPAVVAQVPYRCF